MSDPTYLTPTPPRKSSAASRAALLTAVLALVGLVVAAWLVASNDDTDDDTEGAAPTPTTTSAAPTLEPKISRYVALGDSMTSAPYLPEVDPAGGCYRSSQNYPSLLADELNVSEFVDVSCGGASTEEMTSAQFADVPPQFDALTRDTDLVTLTLGGNDFDIYRVAMGGCARIAASDPSGSPCREAAQTRAGDALLGRIDALIPRLVAVLGQIKERAPHARVVLIGYPRMVPTSGTCPTVLPFAAGDYAYLDKALRHLDDAQREAAQDAGVDFLDMYAASEGHDACSAHPWVNGMYNIPDGPARYHSFPAEQEAVAARLVALLR